MRKEIAVHELKTWPQYWEALESGAKTFEVRKLDRLFGVGDTLHLREWSPTAGYSGREMKKTITYLMAGGQWGLSEGNCILGIKSLLTPPADVQERAKELELFKRLWYNRNPVHENNADSGEDMFWGTAELVAREYAQHLAGASSVSGVQEDVEHYKGQSRIDRKALDNLTDKFSPLQAENERLREVLEKIKGIAGSRKVAVAGQAQSALYDIKLKCEQALNKQ